MRGRVSISGCFGVIGFLAVVLAALKSSSVYWVTAAAWVVLLWLSVSVVGAFFSAGSARVFWTGFAAFGWIYMILIHTSAVSSTLSDQIGAGLRLFLDDALAPSPGSLTGNARHTYFSELTRYKLRVRVVADLVLNLAFAFVGGLTALRFAAGRDADRRQRPTPAPGPDA
jgi:hypothetical protein